MALAIQRLLLGGLSVVGEEASACKRLGEEGAGGASTGEEKMGGLKSAPSPSQKDV